MEFQNPAATRALMDLLDGVSSAEIRSFGIEALRRWRKREPPQHGEPINRYAGTVFQMHGDLGLEMVKLLAERKKLASVDLNALKEPFQDDEAMFRDWMSGVAEFIWWLVRAGLAVNHTFGNKSQDPSRFKSRVFPTSMRLTARGVQLLEAAEDDPLLPGFLDRIKVRCPRLPDGVIALLVDARACLDNSLLRPAVVLMGVAYELAIEEVVQRLELKGLLKEKTIDAEAGVRLKRIRELFRTEDKIKHLFPERDDRRRAEAAYDFADVLRLRRNEAAHTRPAYDFEHVGEVEEFLVSAGRHLPALWSLADAAG